MFFIEVARICFFNISKHALEEISFDLFQVIKNIQSELVYSGVGLFSSISRTL